MLLRTNVFKCLCLYFCTLLICNTNWINLWKYKWMSIWTSWCAFPTENLDHFKKTNYWIYTLSQQYSFKKLNYLPCITSVLTFVSSQNIINCHPSIIPIILHLLGNCQESWKFDQFPDFWLVIVLWLLSLLD